MSTKAGCRYALLLSLVWGAQAVAQDRGPYDQQPAPASTESAATVSSDQTITATPPRTSNWLSYTLPNCCGPMCDGPLTYELYTRTGPSVPVGGGFLADQLATGWLVEGGARTLFFNPYRDAAWVVDLGISYQYNHVDPTTFPIGTTTFHAAALHRTYGDLGFGQELYLLKAANIGGWNWRVGWDVGGRWGTTRLDVYDAAGNFSRLPNTIGSFFTTLHSDFERPCGCCTFLGGFRAEYSYTWQDVLPQPSDIQDVNFLLNFGVRF